MSQPSGVADDKEFTERYHRALVGFLEFVGMMDVEKHRVADHLRYPASEHSSLVGSEVGREIWDGPVGMELIDALLQDAVLASWFSPPTPTRLIELYRRSASFVERWGESTMSPDEFVDARASSLLKDMRNPNPVVRRYAPLFGVQAAGFVELPGGRSIDTGAEQTMRGLLAGTGARESDFLRASARPFTLALGRSSCSRDFANASAASFAYGWSWLLLELTRWDLWLATGVLPSFGGQFVFEEADFPVAPFERVAANPSEVFSGRGLASVDEGLLLEIGGRTAALRGSEQFPDDIAAPLRLLERFMHKGVGDADPAMGLLLTYAGLDGLLRHRHEPETRVITRLSALVANDPAEAKRLRTIAEGWYQIRSSAAHGEPPQPKHVRQFVGDADPAIADYGPDSSVVSDLMLRRSAHIFRRAFLALLWCSVDVEGGATVPGLQRDQILEALDVGLWSNAATPLTKRVPDFVRGMGLMPL